MTPSSEDSRPLLNAAVTSLRDTAGWETAATEGMPFVGSHIERRITSDAEPLNCEMSPHIAKWGYTIADSGDSIVELLTASGRNDSNVAG